MSELYEIDIHSSIKDYTVKIKQGIAKNYIINTDHALVVDENLLSLHPWIGRRPAISLKADEEHKTLAAVANIIKSLRDVELTRGGQLIAVGGGIIQDVATFAASSYMRGILWHYCPTTLLSMVDSCVGGKSSINIGPYKNLAGNYYPPEQILIDTEFCGTLPNVQKIEGLCEAVKICFASTDDAFERYLKLMAAGDILNDTALLAELIMLTLSTKKKFIETDEFDRGVRLNLNFGHTFGHALESASDYRLSHGLAVAVGMLASLKFSKKMGYITRTNKRVQALIDHIRWLLSNVIDLLPEIESIPAEETLKRFRADKKHKADAYTVIAINQEGFLERRLFAKSDRTEALVYDSLKTAMNVYEV